MFLFGPTTISLDEDELNFRRKALRNAIVCLGWLRLVSTLIYVGLYFLVAHYSKGSTSDAIQIMTLCTIGPCIVVGVMLIMGAIDEKGCILTWSIWLSLLLAAYTTVLGALGGIYFIRKAKYTVQFILACLYGCLACSVFTVLCHDVGLVYTYRNMVTAYPPLRDTVYA